MSFSYQEIERVLGYTFRDKSLLKEAFTHSTYANIHGGKDNERLEYLGDAVLQLVVTEWQYKDDERANEGELTRERQQLVCGDALDDAVENLNLQKYLLIEGGKANIGKKTVSSIFEAVAAAIYLDGGYD
ncbi:MAG: ribonuclease III, partial [Clostridia bacterium]|nr:ribonuclease III [Clostridia bacterium]